MGSRLSGIGKLWCALSFFSAVLSCLGLYAPYWMHGHRGAANESLVAFGPFRECVRGSSNESATRQDFWATLQVLSMQDCSPYWTFTDIPSFSWQTATVLSIFGCATALFVSYITLLACCMKFMTRGSARAFGLIQLLSGACLASGCILFPTGWNSAYVARLCSEEAGIYRLGRCTIGWAYYVMLAGTSGVLLGTCLSLGASLDGQATQRKECRDEIPGLE